MTKLLYLTDSYIKKTTSRITSLTKKGDHYELQVEATVFYPEGGGQPSDRGLIHNQSGKLSVTHVRMHGDNVIHEGKLEGTLETGDEVKLEIDWDLRFDHMRTHSAGHVLHEVINEMIPGIKPLKGQHDKHGFIEYEGVINPTLLDTIQKRVNLTLAAEKSLTTKLVTLEELQKMVSYVPERLPKNKPLRILQIEGFSPTPDGGTQVKNTAEIGSVNVTQIEQNGETVRVHYETPPLIKETKDQEISTNQNEAEEPTQTLENFRTLLLEQQSELLELVSQATPTQIEPLRLLFLGASGKSTELIRTLRNLPISDRKTAGILVNEFKRSIDAAFATKTMQVSNKTTSEWFDTSLPGISPPRGSLHIISQAISEISRIFERIGFTRVRHPEVDLDWYAFGSLNMPAHHPARDEWETFFIDYPGKPSRDPKRQKVVLTPHTSNGQVREMEKGVLPIRMINIAKCYRRQIDVSHTPMFHQFEGLYIDKHVSIAHLKGVCDYFFKQFYGADRVARLRPFHFQFTEPSFEIDVTCGICKGKGKLPSGENCKLCKQGWLELGGAGMVHPTVLRNGGIDPDIYSGFAFGWGVERTYMMKSGTELDDIRLLYSNDIRFLEQF